jgi:hypothetical protein
LVARGTARNSFAYQIEASNSPTAFSVSGLLPAGLSLDPNSGTISGSPSLPGSYSVAIAASNPQGTTPAVLTIIIDSASGANASWIANLSARAIVQGQQNILITGFVTSGTSSKALLVRGVGPSLAQFDVSNFLPDPQMTLFDSGGDSLASITAWDPNLSSTFAEAGAFNFVPGSIDTATVQSFSPGAYTVQVASTGSNSGVALAEIYDLGAGDPVNRLVNISARAMVGTGSDILIGGFVVGGNALETLLIRGVGPTLSSFGINNYLASPVLTIYDSSNNVIASIAGWGNDAVYTPGPGLDATSGMSVASCTSGSFTNVGAFMLADGSADSAMIITLPAGTYTAQVAGENGATGVALVEIYEMK